MKSAIVTGAAGDLGLSIAQTLARQGYRVGVLDIDADAVAAACASVDGGVPLVCDITSESAVARAFDAFGEAPTPAVNNAAIGAGGALIDLPLEAFECVIRVNLTGAFLVTREAVRRMLPRGSGHVVSIASVNAHNPGINGGAYPASKAALLQLSKQFALEYGAQGLRFNSVSPGFIDGGMSTRIYADQQVREARIAGIPLRRLGTPADVANAVLMLDSNQMGYVSGIDLLVDGALTHAVLRNLAVP